ncbi:MAG: hypothetical protein GKR96_07975 [Gammaproteobacteria bacterium]|nr:hypothetical protein [Gammaproteobacteria bacterium]
MIGNTNKHDTAVYQHAISDKLAQGKLSAAQDIFKLAFDGVRMVMWFSQQSLDFGQLIDD